MSREVQQSAAGAPLRPGRSGRLGGILLVNAATFVWSTNIVLGRSLRGEIGPITLAALRFLVGAAILAALLRAREPEARRPGRDAWLLLAMGVSGVVLFAPILYLALRYTTALNGTLIQALAPLVTGVLAALLIREPMSRFQAAGAVAGLTGVAVLISRGSPAFFQNMRASLGDLIMLVAVLLWSSYTVASRRATARRTVLSATALSTLLGLPFLLAAMAWEWRSMPPQMSPRLLLTIVYLGIGPTVVGFLSWNAGVRRLGSSGAMVFYNTLPLYGVVLAAMFLGEELGVAQLVGGALIVGGALWATKAAKGREKTRNARTGARAHGRQEGG